MSLCISSLVRVGLYGIRISRAEYKELIFCNKFLGDDDDDEVLGASRVKSPPA